MDTQPATPKCADCGYDRSGDGATICPECASTRVAQPRQSSSCAGTIFTLTVCCAFALLIYARMLQDADLRGVQVTWSGRPWLLEPGRIARVAVAFGVGLLVSFTGLLLVRTDRLRQMPLYVKILICATACAFTLLLSDLTTSLTAVRSNESFFFEQLFPVTPW